MKIIGLTGQTGAGKSTVAAWLRAHGTVCIDADRVSRTVAKPGTAAFKEVIAAFGKEMLSADGTLNRCALGNLVFADEAKRKQLESILFPHIIADIRRQLEKAEKNGAAVAVLDAPTLFESGLDKICTRTVGVVADENRRYERIVSRDGLTADAAKARMNAQKSEAYFCTHCDEIIENNGDREALEKRIREVFDL